MPTALGQLTALPGFVMLPRKRMKKRRGSAVKAGTARQCQYTVLFEPQEGGYNVIVPAIPEICTFGETMEEAREMAEDAISCHLESALKHGEPIPKDAESTTGRFAVSL